MGALMEKFSAIETSRVPQCSSHPTECESNESSGKVLVVEAERALSSKLSQPKLSGALDL